MTNKGLLPAICWPIPKNNRGDKFIHLEEVLSHLEDESSGHWLIGSQGMWHGGLHITDATTPWCALSGHAAHEAIDYPLPYPGEQPVCCMADGEVVAYRINRDYLSVPWETGDRFYSGSFVLVRHYIQPGQTKESGLTFYTLYMHLAPWLAYMEQENTTFKVADGQHLNAYVDASLQWTVAQLKPGTRVTWDKTAKSDTIIGANGRQYSCVTLDEPVNGSMSLKVGDRVWTLSDNNNLVPVGHSPICPEWWSSLLPPSRNVMQFDSVECPTPYPIKAGDAIGHMGWYQALKDGGHKKRYQVHIECLTTDDLPRFLSNPEGVERDRPAFARCPAGISMYLKDSAGKTRDSNVKTLTEKVISLSGQAVKDINGKRYWPSGLSRGLLAESDLRLLSQYDLAERGFDIIEDSPASFDHLDGKTKPRGLVRSIFQRFFNVADNDGQLGSQIVAFNYQQLVNNIDTPTVTWYEPEQYRRAVHHPSMRDHLYRLCVKHPSQWYFSTEDPVWKQYLSWMKKEAPEWHRSWVIILKDIRWMHRVAGMVENPWHMHPLVFLDALRKTRKRGWAHSPFAELLGSVESNNDYTAYNRTWPHPHPTNSEAHYNTNLTSMTISQIMAAQKTHAMFATGRFQIIPGTLKDAVKALDLDVNALYDEAMQDKIFEEYLIKVKRKPIIDYLEGDGSVEDAAYAWALEFASAGVRKGREICSSQNDFERDPDGRIKTDKWNRRVHKKRWAQADGISYYSGDGLNKAHIMPDDMVRKLEESKNEN